METKSRLWRSTAASDGQYDLGRFRYPHGTKLVTFDRRGDCSLCWEGETAFTYSFAENARVDVNFSDRLSTSDRPLVVVRDRIKKVFNQLWQANLDDKDSQFTRRRLSFLFGGYCPVYQEVQVWHIQQDEQLQEFTIHWRSPTATKPCFIGSGSAHAKSLLAEDSTLSPYNILLKVIEDPTVDDVGGIPQLVAIDSEGINVIGVIKDGERYLFGRKLNSSGHKGHKTNVRYVSYDGDDL